MIDQQEAPILPQDFHTLALARLPVEPPARATPLGDHSLSTRVLSPEAMAAARPAAVLVPVVTHATGATVLLTQRASNLRKHSGQIAFPGGKIDEPGETPFEAALRETWEEVGLARQHLTPLGYLDPYYTGTGYRITPVVALAEPPFALNPNAAEVAQVFEVPLAFLMQPRNHQRVTREHDGRSFYAMHFQEHYIWGATAGIIRHLYERLYL